MIDLKSEYDIEEYARILHKSLDGLFMEFGTEVICLSESCQSLIKKIKKTTATESPVLFTGESGSGRSFFSGAHFYYHSKGVLLEYNSILNHRESLDQVIQKYEKSQSKKKRTGLLIKNVHYMNEDILELLVSFLESRKAVDIYFTAGALRGRGAVPGKILSFVGKNRFDIPALRTRTDDIKYQIIWFTKKYSEQYGVPYRQISDQVIQDALRYDWPGNTRELIHAIKRAIVKNQSPMIEYIDVVKKPIIQKNKDLSPIEAMEKEVMINYLLKFKYNKNRVSRELDITINTLNSRMEKFGIEIPEPYRKNIRNKRGIATLTE